MEMTGDVCSSDGSAGMRRPQQLIVRRTTCLAVPMSIPSDLKPDEKFCASALASRSRRREQVGGSLRCGPIHLHRVVLQTANDVFFGEQGGDRSALLEEVFASRPKQQASQARMDRQREHLPADFGDMATFLTCQRGPTSPAALGCGQS